MLFRDTASFLPQTFTDVSAEALLQRICVRPPYFALRQVRAQPGALVATVRAELPPGPEIGPIQGAELSRHAAIAGLCVAALAQPDDQRRYYLAQHARYEGRPSAAPYGAEVVLQADLLHLDKRAATAYIEARAGGQPLAAVEVHYTVLTDSAFSRLFRTRARPAFRAGGPARMPALPAGEVRAHDGRWTRHIAQVPEAACAGHFDGYPAMPVAILMGQLANLAGQALGAGRAYHIAGAQVDAHDFCWAGEAATFEVAPERRDGPRTLFGCQALAAGRTVGQMQLTLDRC